jgi:hypothetical protein
MVGTNEIRELTLDELEAVSGGGSKTIQTQMTIGDTTIVIAANSDGHSVCTYKGDSNFGHCTYGR